MTLEEKIKIKKTSFFTKRNLIILVILLALVVAELIRSNTYIQIENITIKHEKIPKSFDGCKIVQISDYHNHGGPYDDILLAKIKKEKPDYIFITGDIADALVTNIKKANIFLEKISKITKCYLVWGNHDYNISDTDLSLMEKCANSNGIVILENEFINLKRNNDEILLVGTVSKMDSSFVKNMFENYPDDDLYTIWLHHYPENFKEIVDKSELAGDKADLIFSGHAHGGLIRLPIITIQLC